MAITLYTAPDCIRCKIVKGYFADKGVEYGTIDFKDQKDEFNAFYRANRAAIYRNPEGVEFPLFDDGKVVLQGSGIIIAHMISGDKMKDCVLRSDLLHGWLSGLYPSLCPAEQEANFIELLKYLATGGLKVYLQPDGRKPEFLQKVLESGYVTKVVLNVLGGPEAYERAFGGAVGKEDLKKSIELVQAFPKNEVRLLISPTKQADGSVAWTSKEEAAEAAKMVADAVGKPTITFGIAAVDKEMPQGLQGLQPFPEDQLLPYRAAVRKHLFKADISKPEQ